MEMPIFRFTISIMTKNNRKKRAKPAGRKTKGLAKYSPAEWFMVLLGGALVILVAGIIISAILG
jgi:hypothetical protein